MIPRRNAPRDSDVVLAIRGQGDLPPIELPSGATAWSLAQARAACRAYAEATDLAKAHSLSWSAWPTVSRHLDAANGLNASSRRSLVRQDFTARLAGEAYWEEVKPGRSA